MESIQQKLGIILPNLIVMILVGIGFMPPEEQSPTERPSHKDHTEKNVPALTSPLRVTYDPFHSNSAMTKTQKLDSIDTVFGDWYRQIAPFKNVPKAQWEKFKGDPTNPKLSDNKWIDRGLVLLVTLPGDSFPIQIEQRRRTRYAILSALANAGYCPVLDQKIGIVNKWSPNTAIVDTPSDSLVVYEKFVPSSSLANWRSVNYSQILVCYLSETDLTEEKINTINDGNNPKIKALNEIFGKRNPFINLSYFINSLQYVRNREDMKLPFDVGDQCRKERRCELQIIGPSNSSLYRDFLATATTLEVINHVDKDCFLRLSSWIDHVLYFTCFNHLFKPAWSEGVVGKLRKNLNGLAYPIIQWKSINYTNRKYLVNIRSSKATLSSHHVDKFVVNYCYSRLLKYSSICIPESVVSNSINPNAATETLYTKSFIRGIMKNIRYHSDKAFFKNEDTSSSEKIQYPFGYSIQRTNPDDEYLCKAIALEIKNRGYLPKEGKENQQILVISESDTPYGRLIVESFIRAYNDIFILNEKEEHNYLGLTENGKTQKITWEDESRITYLRYFRGIEEQDSKPYVVKQPSSEQGTSVVKSDFGRSQSDYIKRLLIDIRQHEMLKSGKYKHVVIFSSDIYDKIHIVRELKKIIPNAHYYTTDLDATLTSRSEIEFTRNMVVASTFNLTLPPSEQLRTPPFRDSYQTATYLEALDAIRFLDSHSGDGKPLPATTASKRIHYLTNQVHLFEIGRHKPQLLQSFKIDRTKNEKIMLDREREPWEMKPEERLGYVPGIIFILGAILFACVIIVPVTKNLLKMHRAKKEDLKRDLAESNRVFNFFCLLLLLACWASILWCGIKVTKWSTNPHEEPFSLISGISVWPSAFIMLLVINTAILSFWLSAKDLASNRNKIEVIFKDILQDENRNKIADSKLGIFEKMVNSLSFLFYSKQLSEKNMNFNAFWSIYHQRSRQSERIFRSLVLSLVTVFIYLFCAQLSGEVLDPVRGEGSSAWFKVIQFIAFCSSHFLTAYVIDACLLTRSLHLAFLTWIKTKSKLSDNMNLDIGIQEVPRVCKPLQDIKIIKNSPYDVENENIHMALWETAIASICSKRCKVLYSIILYPFITYFLIILSRSNHFDQFNWAIQLTVPTVFGVLIMIFIISNIRKQAKLILKITANRIDREIELLAHVKVEGDDDDKWKNARLDALNGDKRRNIIAESTLIPGILKSPIVHGLAYPLIATLIYYITGVN